MLGHQLDFFLGDARACAIARCERFAEIDPDAPHTEFVRAMAAFGLEEAGSYERGVGRGPRGRRRPTPTTCGASTPWCTPTRCRVESTKASASSLRTRTEWETGNLFTVHNWWHLALYQLEAGQPQRALDDLRRRDPQRRLGWRAPIEMLDASALLWRLLLDGVDTGDRFARARRGVGAEGGRHAVVRLQRSARGHGSRRRRPRRATSHSRHPGPPAVAGRRHGHERAG